VHGDRGDIITGYLLRLVGGLALAGLLVIEGTAVTINRIGLEEAVARAAHHGASAYGESHSLDAAEQAAEQRLDRADARLVDLSVGGDSVTVTGGRQAKVVVSHRIDALSDLVTPSRTGTAEIGR
jgi:hypothetical protein